MTPVLPPKISRVLRRAVLAAAFLAVGIVSPARAVCVNPAGNEGTIIYNESFSTLQYCDDNNWLSIDSGQNPLNIAGAGDWESSENDFLGWTPGTAASSNTQQTFSFWIKRESAGVNSNALFGSWPGGAAIPSSWAVIGTDNRLYIGHTAPSGEELQLFTGGYTFSDTANWHHVLIQFDMTQAVLTNKIRLWVDGASTALGLVTGDDEPMTTITSSLMNGSQQTVGAFPGSTADDFDGLIAEFHAIDGALIPVSGFYDSGIARRYTGGYGTNGFYLNFANAADPGQDASGRGNDFTNTGVVLDGTSMPSSETLTGLVGDWKLNETSGTVVYNNGGTINGTMQNGLTGADSAPGKMGAALDFDGADDFIIFPNNAALNLTSVTLGAWIRPTAVTSTEYGIIIMENRTAGNTANYELAIDGSGNGASNDGLVKLAYYSGGWQTIASTITPVANEWQHIAVTVDSAANTYAFYLNGQPAGSGSTPVDLATYAGTQLRLGTSAVPGFNDNFAGLMDEVRVYNRALTANEVRVMAGVCGSPAGIAGDIRYDEAHNTVIYCNGRGWQPVTAQRVMPSAANLVAHYKFEHTSGTSLTDHAGAHTGTLNNFALPAAWTAGQIGGNSLNFDGANDFVALASPADFIFNPASNYTWAAWINPDDFEEWNTIFGMYNTVDGDPTFAIFAHSTSDASWGPVTAGIAAGGNLVTGSLLEVSTDNVLTVGTWSHVTVTYDSALSVLDRFKIYVNGIEVTDYTDNFNWGTLSNFNPANVRLGHDGWSGEFFDGRIDDFRFYTRVLSQDEIGMLASYGPATGCTSPVGSAGMMIYNNTANVVQFCNGKDWVAAGR